MTILEAKKLAEQGKTVVSPRGKVYDIEQFQEYDFPFSREDVFGEWREKREPRRVYGIENSNSVIHRLVFVNNDLSTGPGERIVEFVEVIE